MARKEEETIQTSKKTRLVWLSIICILIVVIIIAVFVSGITNKNLRGREFLPIPPLGTQFDFSSDGEEINWSVGPHPRMLATPGIIETLAADKDSRITQDLISAARQQKALMETNPGYREAVGPIVCAWGYLLTGNQDFLDVVKKALKWLTVFPPVVKSPEGANFPFIQQAFSLGAVYDLLYDKLSDNEREKIEKVLRETVYHTLAYKVTTTDKEINFWANDPYSSYYVVFHATAGLIAVNLFDIEPDAPKLAALCWHRINKSLDVFHQGQGWREGLTYLDSCWGQSALYFFLALERNSDLKPFEMPWFMDSIKWAVWGALPDRATIACFGDNEPENYSVGSYLARVAALTGDMKYLHESQETAKYVDLALDLPIFQAACADRPPLEEASFNKLHASYGIYRIFKDIEWGIIRSGPDGTRWKDENDFYCAFKSGIAGYHHNHLDQGHFILGAFSEVLLSDPGRGGHDLIRRNPYINCLFEAGLGHNTLIVDDGCYEDLNLFPDNPDYFSRPGTITWHEETHDRLQFTTDNSGLYPKEPLNKFQRTFIYIKPGIIREAELGALLIIDRIAFDLPKSHSILFHTPGEVKISGPAQAEFVNGSARLDYYGFCSIESIDKVEKQTTGMPIRDSVCLFRSTKNESTGSDWIHVLIPARVEAPPSPEPEFRRFMFGVIVAWENYELTLLVDPRLGWVAKELPQINKETNTQR